MASRLIAAPPRIGPEIQAPRQCAWPRSL